MGRTAALVPAAGRGERLGPGTPKALRQLAGVPMFVHAVNALTESRAVDLVIVAVPAESVDEVSALLVQQQFNADVSVVAGGDTRPESVARALIGLPAECCCRGGAARPPCGGAGCADGRYGKRGER